MCLISALDAASKLLAQVVGARTPAGDAVLQVQQQTLLWGLVLLGHCCCDTTDILRGAAAGLDDAAATHSTQQQQQQQGRR
jgi:hypothetical protein